MWASYDLQTSFGGFEQAVAETSMIEYVVILLNLCLREYGRIFFVRVCELNGGINCCVLLVSFWRCGLSDMGIKLDAC